jgi:cytochrome c553
MQPIRFALSLIAIAALSACGDGTPSSGTGASQTGSVASTVPGPWDTLAALPPEAQPYGLDVYTAKCASCHGNLGQGVGKNPSITGLTPSAMQQKLLDYRSGKIKGKGAAAKANLSDAEIAAVSIYAGE